MKKRLLYVLLGILIIALPILIGYIVSVGVVSWIVVENDWIGFWGGYLGGLFTLAGVMITIYYAKKDSIERQRMSVIPYISVVRNDITSIDEKEIPMGLQFALSESRNRKTFLFFNTAKIIGKIKNVGLGPVINCYIRNIKIGKRSMNTNTNEISVLTINEESLFIIRFFSIGLSRKQLGRIFIESYNDFWRDGNYTARVPELGVAFDFCFEDVVGTKYVQKVVYTGQLCEPQRDTADSADFIFESISKPGLV